MSSGAAAAGEEVRGAAAERDALVECRPAVQKCAAPSLYPGVPKCPEEPLCKPRHQLGLERSKKCSLFKGEGEMEERR